MLWNFLVHNCSITVSCAGTTNGVAIIVYKFIQHHIATKQSTWQYTKSYGLSF